METTNDLHPLASTPAEPPAEVVIDGGKAHKISKYAATEKAARGTRQVNQTTDATIDRPKNGTTDPHITRSGLKANRNDEQSRARQLLAANTWINATQLAYELKRGSNSPLTRFFGASMSKAMRQAETGRRR